MLLRVNNSNIVGVPVITYKIKNTLSNGGTEYRDIVLKHGITVDVHEDVGNKIIEANKIVVKFSKSDHNFKNYVSEGGEYKLLQDLGCCQLVQIPRIIKV